MYRNKTILGIITARGGSKRIPYKNIKPLLGKPLIAWTIEAARHSRYIDRLIVSTEDKEIAKISERYAAEVPFLRPAKLAKDDTKSIDVILHAIKWLKKHDNIIYDLILLLQPTSPLRLSEDIEKAVEILFYKKGKAVVSVAETEYDPRWAHTLKKDNCMQNFARYFNFKKSIHSWSRYYRINGAVYIAYQDYLEIRRGFLGDETYAYIMPRDRSVDIDTEMDFKFAEFLLKSHNPKNRE